MKTDAMKTFRYSRNTIAKSKITEARGGITVGSMPPLGTSGKNDAASDNTVARSFIASSPGLDPTKLFFLRFPIFAVKLGHFLVNTFFSYVTNTQA